MPPEIPELGNNISGFYYYSIHLIKLLSSHQGGRMRVGFRGHTSLAHGSHLTLVEDVEVHLVKDKGEWGVRHPGLLVLLEDSWSAVHSITSKMAPGTPVRQQRNQVQGSDHFLCLN